MIFIRYLLLQFKVYLPIKQENTNNFVLLSLIAAPSVSVAGEEKEPSFYDNCYFDSDSDEEGTSEGMYVWWLQWWLIKWVIVKGDKVESFPLLFLGLCLHYSEKRETDRSGTRSKGITINNTFESGGYYYQRIWRWWWLSPTLLKVVVIIANAFESGGDCFYPISIWIFCL